MEKTGDRQDQLLAAHTSAGRGGKAVPHHGTGGERA